MEHFLLSSSEVVLHIFVPQQARDHIDNNISLIAQHKAKRAAEDDVRKKKVVKKISLLIITRKNITWSVFWYPCNLILCHCFDAAYFYCPFLYSCHMVNHIRSCGLVVVSSHKQLINGYLFFLNENYIHKLTIMFYITV